MLSTSKPEIGAKRRRCIIGGLFGLECTSYPQHTPPSFLTGRYIFLVNARSGIWLLVNHLKPPKVWVPSYLCHTILEAVDLSLTNVRYYEVDYNLKISSDHWIDEVTSGDLVIFIDYFGFPYDHKLGACVKERGAWVLEDAAQALLSSHVGLHSDFVLFSLRKWIGVPDGGILRFPEGFPLVNLPLEVPQATWWLKAFHATGLRRQFGEGCPTREWFKLLRDAEDAAPLGPYAMSQITNIIIENSVNYSIVAQRRIDNYLSLKEELTDYAIFPNLEPGIVPFGFPVRVKNRDEVRQSLFEHEKFTPVHWSIDGIVPSKYEDSHELARHIMTIPCDQRYTRKDMKRITKVFLEHAI